MMRSPISIALAGGVFALSATAKADVIEHTNIRYEFEQKEDNVAKSCNVMLTSVNFPAPETFNFRLIYTFGKQAHLGYVGFSLDVADVKFFNGVPAGLQKVRLASASFSSETFNSSGRLSGGPVEDGGIIESSADSETSTAFTMAFMSGDFQISFIRDGQPGWRTYKIKDPPSQMVFQRFVDCIKTLH